MKALPIGIQSFEEVVSRNLLYVDKTEDIHRLLLQGKYYFLSRPRRFGKSLLLSTIKELFLGSKDLFSDLWIESRWDWEHTYPVIHLEFNSLDYKELGLAEAIKLELHRQAALYQISIEGATNKLLFQSLLKRLFKTLGRVVILIDEYDKPLIDYLGKDHERALVHLDTLKNIYSVIKSADPYIHFFLITGVSKFSKVSLFSDLNNLHDITLHPAYSSLVGLKEEEIDLYLGEYVEKVANEQNQPIEAIREGIRQWYNGYSWDGKVFVYNPFALFLFLSEGRFRNFWFETGTPTFLLEWMKKEKSYQFERFLANEASFAVYDIARIRLIPLLFQTGYLTIKSIQAGRYELDYPNKEVQLSMYQYILADLIHEDPALTTNYIFDLREAFSQDNMPALMGALDRLLAGVPHEIFVANQEVYYHSLLHIAFQFLALEMEAEVSNRQGRLDVVVQTISHIYIIELELDKSANEAIRKIKEQQYYAKYLGINKKMCLVGINFSSEKKGVGGWEAEEWVRG